MQNYSCGVFFLKKIRLFLFFIFFGLFFPSLFCSSNKSNLYTSYLSCSRTQTPVCIQILLTCFISEFKDLAYYVDNFCLFVCFHYMTRIKRNIFQSIYKMVFILFSELILSCSSWHKCLCASVPWWRPWPLTPFSTWGGYRSHVLCSKYGRLLLLYSRFCWKSTRCESR